MLGRKWLVFGVTACAGFVGLVSIAAWWLVQGLLGSCQTALESVFDRGDRNQCQFDVNSAGVRFSATGLRVTSSRLDVAELSATLDWRGATQLAMALGEGSPRRVWMGVPVLWHVEGVEWTNPGTGRVRWSGGTVGPVFLDPVQPFQVSLRAAYDLLDHPQRTSGMFEGQLTWQPQPSVSLTAPPSWAGRLSCLPCTLSATGLSHPLELSLELQRGSESERRVSLAVSGFLLGELDRFLISRPLPNAVSSLRVDFSLDDRVFLAEQAALDEAASVPGRADTVVQHATTHLSLGAASGVVDLRVLVPLIMGRLEDAAGVRCDGSAAPAAMQSASRGAGAVAVTLEAICRLGTSLLPERIDLSSGKAQMTLQWLGPRLVAHKSMVDLHAVVPGQGPASGAVVTLTGGHGGREDQHDSWSADQLAVAVRGVDFVKLPLRVVVEPPGAQAAGADLIQRLAFLSHMRPETRLPPEEARRLVEKLVERVAGQTFDKLGLAKDAETLIKNLDQDTLGELEREGKSWLKNALQGADSKGDLGEREAARKNQRESERKLKEALGRILEN